MEKETIQSKIEEYLRLLGEIKARTGDDRTALSILQEVNKDLRMAQIRAERDNGHSNGNGDEAPATSRQKTYLKKLGVAIPASLTKKQASGLIDEALEKESEQDSFEMYRPIPQTIPIPWYGYGGDSWDFDRDEYYVR